MALYMKLCTVISALVLININTVIGDDLCGEGELCTVKPDYYDKIQYEIDEKIEEISQKFNFNYFDDTDTGADSMDNYDGQNCAYLTEIIKPYTVKVNSTTKVIVQSKFYEQLIKQTTCAYSAMNSEEPKCFNGVSTTIKGICQQKYTSISIYLFDNDTKKIQRYPVLVPVCCYCDISG